MLYIILPAYNEEKTLARLLTKMRDTLEGYVNYEIVIVDDGSSDNTAEVARVFGENMKIRLIQHETNRGLGVAMTTAFSFLRQNLGEDDLILTMDADNTHDPGLSITMINMLKEQRLDIVIASRFVDGADEIGLSFYRKLLSRGAGMFLKLLYPIRGVKDYSSGYRLYSASIIKRAFEKYHVNLIEEIGFACMVELLIKLDRLDKGVRIGEVPLVLRYDLKEGKSKMKVLRTIYRYIVIIAKARNWKKQTDLSPKN